MLFNDKPEAPFSVHNITAQGVNMGKPTGSWLGPNSISVILSQLASNNKLPVAIYNTKQLVVQENEISQLCGGRDNWIKSLLLLVPCQLGLNRVNPIYLKSLSLYLQLPQSIGFIGGRPSAAYYFVAMQDDILYYLDPHLNQPVTDISHNSSFEDMTSYFCFTPKTININSIDESLALGFFL